MRCAPPLRIFLPRLLLILAAIGASDPAIAGDGATRARIVYLSLVPPTANFDAFRKRIAQLGYAEGSRLSIDYLIAKGDQAALERLAAQAASSGANAIVAVAPNASLAAKQATSSVPIVFVSGSDPVGLGLVTSLARPGGNVTGFSNMPADLVAKRLELLKQLVPGLRRVGILARAGNPNHRNHLDDWTAMARSLGLEPEVALIGASDDFDAAMADLAARGVRAVCLIQDSVFYQRRDAIAAAALRHRLPVIADSHEYAEAGLLVAYGADYREVWQHTAEYVVRILRGEKPGDLPVQQPAALSLTVNLGAADRLGLTLPPAIIQLSNAVIR